MGEVKDLAITITKRLTERAIRCTFSRHSLWDHPDGLDEDDMVFDALGIALGEDVGCLGPEEEDAEHIDVLFVEEQLRALATEAYRRGAQSMDLAAANAQIQELQQGRCGMCNEFPGNPVHGSGEGQHAFVSSEAEIMTLNAAVVHEAQRYAALEKRLETTESALRYVIEVRAIRCTSHPAGDLSCARCRADAALVSEDGQ